MINEIIKFYEIGKELGLTKKEINKVFVMGRSNRYIFSRVVVFLVVLVLVIVLFFLLFSMGTIPQINNNNSTYAKGTLYSTIKIKDFEKTNKNRVFQKILQKIGSSIFFK